MMKLPSGTVFGHGTDRGADDDLADLMRRDYTSITVRPLPAMAPRRPLLAEIVPMPCPCCGQAVAVPSLDIIIENFGISEFEARILGAIWRGKGRPVSTERVFDAMYCDDPDGGPSRMKMYEAFKFGLHRLRGRLEGSGVWIENVGYRRGYRLVMKENG